MFLFSKAFVGLRSLSADKLTIHSMLMWVDYPPFCIVTVIDDLRNIKVISQFR